MKNNGITGIKEIRKITKFSASEIRKLHKRLKLILENIGLDFIIHTLSILIRLTSMNHFPTLLMHTLSYPKSIHHTWNLRIFAKYRSLTYAVNTLALQLYYLAFCNQNVMLYS